MAHALSTYRYRYRYPSRYYGSYYPYSYSSYYPYSSSYYYPSYVPVTVPTTTTVESAPAPEVTQWTPIMIAGGVLLFIVLLLVLVWALSSRR